MSVTEAPKMKDVTPSKNPAPCPNPSGGKLGSFSKEQARVFGNSPVGSGKK
jgi:hypothetical protein